ncbi:hypothetical protein ABZ934_07070 [Streptomyces sp. NPDC046557]|uniref:hypothetical protein n=1 Tax=Streptomyces sp. NPDC046557 TaxID=3155372 RepID=UPI0033CA42FE
MSGNRHPEPPGYSRDDAFTHLGLPEPETLVESMRSTSVCPRETKTPEGGSLRLCTKVYAHEFPPGVTRLYLRADSDAPLTEPPP